MITTSKKTPYFTTAITFTQTQQAFLKTAESVYEKIKSGNYDPSREGNGVKLGVMATQPKGGSSATAKKGAGCC